MMKNYSEKAKDILYDFSDYIIMGAIILSIVLIIGWRLDILFPETVAMVNKDDAPKIEEEVSQENEKDKGENLALIDAENEAAESDLEKAAKTEPEIIKVSIPNGTPSTSIGGILVDKGLIESTKDFEDKVVELNLETKLHFGEFDISKDESLESIVKIIAHEN